MPATGFRRHFSALEAVGSSADSLFMGEKTFRPWDVDQPMLFPASVKDLVPRGHLSQFLRDVVREELDLSAIYAHYEELRGYPPYHPAMMTALLLYAYCRGIYSSRRIEQACEERVDFMAPKVLRGHAVGQ